MREADLDSRRFEVYWGMMKGGGKKKARGKAGAKKAKAPKKK